MVTEGSYPLWNKHILLSPEKNSLFNSEKHFWQSGFLNFLIMDNLLSPDT